MLFYTFLLLKNMFLCECELKYANRHTYFCASLEIARRFHINCLLFTFFFSSLKNTYFLIGDSWRGYLRRLQYTKETIESVYLWPTQYTFALPNNFRFIFNCSSTPNYSKYLLVFSFLLNKRKRVEIDELSLCFVTDFILKTKHGCTQCI